MKIKHAYDTALADSQQEAAEVGPLQSKVATVAEDCERKILQIKQAERDDINTTKDMNKNLKKEIANQKLEILDLQAKVDKLGKMALESKNMAPESKMAREYKWRQRVKWRCELIF